MKRLPRAAMAMIILAMTTACEPLLTGEPDDADLLDSPLPGLSPEELRAFARGDEEFGRAFTPATGLGPIFNNVSCASCHSGDGRGRPENALVRFGEAPGFAAELGGPQLQDRALAGALPEIFPEGMAASIRLPPPVFGVGLIEAIPEDEILSRADPDDADGDGISGRVHRVRPPDWVERGVPGAAGPDGYALGRFSRKAQVSSLLQQVVEAYHQDIGITTDYIPTENVNPAAVDGTLSADRVADPELDASTVRAVIAYLRLLAPPAPGPETAEVALGRTLFDEVGCARCHVPVLRTGDSDLDALAFREVELYSDLLLHDMGPALSDGRQDHDALPGEWRTAPLWGMRVVSHFLDGEMFLMHDGRAGDVEEAVLLHGGEAEGVIQAFLALSGTERAALLRFVESR